LRGCVTDYALKAKRHLAPGGRFVYVMLSQDPRTEAAAGIAGLSIIEKVDFVFRDDGRKPHICTIVCAHSEEVPSDFEPKYIRFVVRDKDGNPTEEYKSFQAYHMGEKGPERVSPPSLVDGFPVSGSNGLDFYQSSSAQEDAADERAIQEAISRHGNAFTKVVGGISTAL